MKFNCQSCKKPKADLIRRESVLMPGMQVNICSTCNDKGYEPRFIIILAARSRKLDKQIRKFIAEDLYEGERILGSDLI